MLYSKVETSLEQKLCSQIGMFLNAVWIYYKANLPYSLMYILLILTES